MKNTVLLVAASLALAACKADQMEIDLGADDISNALQGASVVADIEVSFSSFGDIDSKQREEISRIEAILSDYMTIDDFDLATTSTGFELKIESEIPVTSDPDTAAPYFLLVSQAAEFAGYEKIELRIGADFERMKSAINGVNFMLTPDQFHPTRLKIKGDGLNLLAPGVFVDGVAYPWLVTTVDDRVALTYSGGVYDRTGAVVFVKRP